MFFVVAVCAWLFASMLLGVVVGKMIDLGEEES